MSQLPNTSIHFRPLFKSLHHYSNSSRRWLAEVESVSRHTPARISRRNPFSRLTTGSIGCLARLQARRISLRFGGLFGLAVRRRGIFILSHRDQTLYPGRIHAHLLGDLVRGHPRTPPSLDLF